MKKATALICALIPTLSAFAYYDGYGYSYHSDKMSGFAIFTLIVMIAYIILSIVILVRWWKMTSNVEEIKRHITHDNQQLAYLIAIGEKEQAQKAALKMLVDNLYPLYNTAYAQKAQMMNYRIKEVLPQIKRLGITLPDYVTSAEKFIDYMDGLTGKNFQSK